MSITRLLICHDCETVEELPFFNGDPRDDVLLDHLVQAHRFPNGEEHIGIMGNVDTETWNNAGNRAEILAKISAMHKPGKGDSPLGLEFYATRQTFQEDALVCYAQHGRPKQGCIDWHDDRKRLGNPTSEGWKTGARMYLCEFCPVATWVRTELRAKRGDYKA